MIVCRLKCGDMVFPQGVDIGKAGATPAERVAAKAFDKKICHQPGVAAIAVRERVDSDRAVVQKHGAPNFPL